MNSVKTGKINKYMMIIIPIEWSKHIRIAKAIEDSCCDCWVMRDGLKEAVAKTMMRERRIN